LKSLSSVLYSDLYASALRVEESHKVLPVAKRDHRVDHAVDEVEEHVDHVVAFIRVVLPAPKVLLTDIRAYL
jgi:hypothetical protein